MSDIDMIINRLKSAIDSSGMTYVEIEKASGISKSAIQRYAQKETKKIPISTIEAIGKAVGVSAKYILGWSDNKRDSLSDPPKFDPLPATYKVPRLGRISCGPPLFSEENYDGEDNVPEYVKCDFTLVCEGDSMTGARINDGDVVYIKQQTTAENGQIAAVLIDGTEKLLKRVYVTDDSITLVAENPAYPPRAFFKEDMNRVRIIGVAVAFTSMIR